jgi:hypothetical protein
MKPELWDELKGFCFAVYDNDDLPDGAWLEMLTEQISTFCKAHNLRDDPHDLAITCIKRWG